MGNTIHSTVTLDIQLLMWITLNHLVMDIVYIDNELSKNKKTIAIYKIEINRLLICHSENAQFRPLDFATHPDDINISILRVYEKEIAAEKN